MDGWMKWGEGCGGSMQSTNKEWLLATDIRAVLGAKFGALASQAVGSALAAVRSHAMDG